MSRSKARLAADWFAKLRVNSTTQEVEHADVVTVEAEVTAVSDSVSTTVNSQLTSVSADVATKFDASGGTLSGTIAVAQASTTASSATTLDFGTANNFVVNLTQNTVFTFINATAGSSGVIYLKQDATGGRTFTLPAIAKTPLGGAAIVQETAANSVSIISYTVLDASTVLVNYIGNYA